jgi:hypothetical protein
MIDKEFPNPSQVFTRFARWRMYFQTNQNPNLGNFWWDLLVLFVLVYFMAILSVLRPFVICIWYNFHRFGMLYQEKSGNPRMHVRKHRADTIFTVFAPCMMDKGLHNVA